MYILTHALAVNPARTLVSQLDNICLERFSFTTHPEIIYGNYIRLGTSIPVRNGTDLQTNSCNFISLLRNKQRFAEFLLQNDFYAPVFHRSISIPDNYPIVTRTTLTGKGGEGINFIKSESEYIRKINTFNYWTPFISMEYELRVHIPLI